MLFCVIKNEYRNNTVIVLAQEPLNDFLYEKIKELFHINTGYTASFWAQHINALPSICKTEVIRKPEKNWVVYIEQTIAKAVINEKFVFCDQGLLLHDYFTNEQLENCPHIKTTTDYTYEQLCTFLPSVLSVAYTYMEKPCIQINSPYDCLLTDNGITIQFAKNSSSVSKQIIENALELQTITHKKKLSFIADIRFKNQIVIHTSKAVHL